MSNIITIRYSRSDYPEDMTGVVLHERRTCRRCRTEFYGHPWRRTCRWCVEVLQKVATEYPTTNPAQER